VLYGPSNTGKTTVLDDILYILQDSIPNFIAVCPTSTINESIKRRLPKHCVLKNVGAEWLFRLYERQEMITEMWMRANDLTTLQSLFKRLGSRARQYEDQITKLGTFVENAERYYDSNPDMDHSEKHAQKSALREKQRHMQVTIYRNAIMRFETYLRSGRLTETEKIVINYIGVNPNLCLVLDDASAVMEEWGKNPRARKIVNDIFHQGRHASITLIAAVHDDTKLTPDWRKNAHISIFTNGQSAACFIGRPGNGITPAIRKRMHTQCETLFADTPGIPKHYRKFVYERETDQPSKYIIAITHDMDDFTVGCPPLREMIGQIPETEGAINAGNSFHDMFLPRK
jgi:hypothetical protein